MTILQSLDRYYDRMAARGEAEAPGEFDGVRRHAERAAEGPHHEPGDGPEGIVAHQRMRGDAEQHRMQAFGACRAAQRAMGGIGLAEDRRHVAPGQAGGGDPEDAVPGAACIGGRAGRN